MPRHAGPDKKSALRDLRARIRLAGQRASRLLRAREGLAALEFAIIAPLLIAAFTGLYDLTTGFLAWQRVNMAALAIDQIATAMAATPQNTNILDLADATTAASAIYAYLPDTLTAPAASFGVVITSVVMTPTQAGCTSGCTYNANVAWSGSYQGTAGTIRPCGTLTAVPDASNITPTTLATDAFSPEPILVVDVTYTFHPLFFSYVKNNIVMTRTAYFSPRIGLVTDWFQYYLITGSNDATVLCPGYPAATTDNNVT